MERQTLLSMESSESDERSRGQVVGYVRVSSVEQNPARQFQALGRCDKIFEDRMSGKSRAKRKGLAELMRYVREHDTIRIASLDRLGRDTRDLHAIVDELTEKGCTVTFVSEQITVSKDDRSPMQELFLTFLSAMAQFERSRIRERQAEGIALAKAKGTYEKQRSLSDEDIDAARALVEMGVPKTEVARRYGCSRQTLYAALAGKGVYGKPSSSSGTGG
ncbi:recombinase family protein [Brevibacterium jeotgali]|uniref:Site-specific DNA recombinase n=1 Tax=Brevibacterium jeotgali TaxID=1262550 RepID=A0A2H1L8Y9_9MICO|nr:recombinase family protein [Brevibacterium jeotgali]TWC03251.1 DNA invertase Pin-like site-specific DNA recombinase [Brevibacterium jeotgali]SMY13240.1 Site-specific DNA recombinase [Brevibacterium jeotgali]